MRVHLSSHRWSRSAIPLCGCIATLALGSGAASSVFTFANGTLMAPVTSSGADRVVSMTLRHRASGSAAAMSLQTANAVRGRDPQLLQALAFLVPRFDHFVGEEDAEEVPGAEVSEEYFDVFGVRPHLGRLFDAEEMRQHADVIVLGRRLWQRRFGGNPALVGRGVQLDDRVFTVVGIVDPPRLYATEYEFWTPLDLGALRAQPIGPGSAECFGRLAPSISFARARTSVERSSPSILAGTPAAQDSTLTLIPLAESITFAYQRTYRLALMVSALIFLTACASASLLLLVTIANRAPDFAIHLSLGATSRRLALMLAGEALMVAVAGVLGGFVLSIAATRVLATIWAGMFPDYLELAVDWRVGLSAAVLTIVAAGILAGASTYFMSRQVPAPLLRRVGLELPKIGHPASAHLFVGVETALTLALLGMSLVIVRSLLQQAHAPIGLQPAHLMTATMTPARRYGDTAARRHLYEQMLERTRSMPGVRSAAAISHVPAAALINPPRIMVQRADVAGPPIRVQLLSITEQYFATAETPLVSGREFLPSDASDGGLQPVIVNVALATMLSPEGQALGRPLTIRLADGPVDGIVIGVAAGSPTALWLRIEPQLFLMSDRTSPRRMSLMVRSDLPLPEIATALTRELRAIDKTQPLSNVAAMDQLLTSQLRLPRARATVVSLFAVMAAVLTAFGVSALAAYSVRRRWREMAIRLALGARPTSLAAMVYRETALSIGVGAVAGCLLFWAMGEWVRSLFSGIATADVPTYAAAAVCAAAVPLLATLIPALRAARLEPGRALVSL